MSPTRAAKRARMTPRKCSTATAYPFDKPSLSHSVNRGKHAFKWLLSGLPISAFFSTHFEKTPILLHNPPTKFHSLLTLAATKSLVTSGTLNYGTDLDVTHYTVAQGRVTLNGERGTPATGAWGKFLNDGCSLRLLRPQQHADGVWRLCALLEEFLGCVVGANAYLTPPDSQGFAPHFDDVDAFICQVQGRKRWRVYAARGDGLDALPRSSSVDFSAADMAGQGVSVEAVLEPGDMLYLPRGAVHEAECVGGKGAEASLHVTVSAFQKWTWADLLLASVETAVASAAAEDRALRRTLPLRFTEFAGVSKGAAEAEAREWFAETARTMVRRVARRFPSDAAADVMARRFLRERLPPVTDTEAGVAGEAGLASVVRAVGAGVARVVMDDGADEDGLPRLVHCIGNSRGGGGGGGEGDGEGLKCLPEEALAVDAVLKAYPDGVVVGELPLGQEEDRVELARGLVEMGVAEVVKG